MLVIIFLYIFLVLLYFYLKNINNIDYFADTKIAVCDCNLVISEKCKVTKLYGNDVAVVCRRCETAKGKLGSDTQCINYYTGLDHSKFPDLLSSNLNNCLSTVDNYKRNHFVNDDKYEEYYTDIINKCIQDYLPKKNIPEVKTEEDANNKSNSSNILLYISIGVGFLFFALGLLIYFLFKKKTSSTIQT